MSYRHKPRRSSSPISAHSVIELNGTPAITKTKPRLNIKVSTHKYTLHQNRTESGTDREGRRDYCVCLITVSTVRGTKLARYGVTPRDNPASAWSAWSLVSTRYSSAPCACARGVTGSNHPRCLHMKYRRLRRALTSQSMALRDLLDAVTAGWVLSHSYSRAGWKWARPRWVLRKMIFNVSQ